MSNRREEQAIVERLSKVMLTKLAQNRVKPHWNQESALYLLVKLKEEVGELEDALLRNNVEDVYGEAADVANFAAMIASNSNNVQPLRANEPDYRSSHEVLYNRHPSEALYMTRETIVTAVNAAFQDIGEIYGFDGDTNARIHAEEWGMYPIVKAIK